MLGFSLFLLVDIKHLICYLHQMFVYVDFTHIYRLFWLLWIKADEKLVKV